MAQEVLCVKLHKLLNHFILVGDSRILNFLMIGAKQQHVPNVLINVRDEISVFYTFPVSFLRSVR